MLFVHRETHPVSCCGWTSASHISVTFPSSLSVGNKRCFTSKITHRHQISLFLSASFCLSVLSLCPPTEPRGFLRLNIFSKPVCMCVCMLTASCVRSRVCVCVRIHRGTDTPGLFSRGARKQQPHCFHVLSSLPWQWSWWQRCSSASVTGNSLLPQSSHIHLFILSSVHVFHSLNRYFTFSSDAVWWDWKHL